MILNDYSDINSLLNQFVAELRDENIQKDAMRFRTNIERIGQVLAYELSKKLTFESRVITTPLGTKDMLVPEDSMVLCSVLRAGLPLHFGLLNYFDKAENAFISAYRQHENDEDDFKVVVKYFASPSIQDKTLILIDPMLATGRTLENVYAVLKENGIPKQIHIVSVIASQKGVNYIKDVFPETTQLWVATIDDELTSRGYIVPGLGDAGDLSFGVKQ